MGILGILATVLISVTVGFWLASLFAAARIAEYKVELAHLWDVIRAAGLTEEGEERGR